MHSHRGSVMHEGGDGEGGGACQCTTRLFWPFMCMASSARKIDLFLYFLSENVAECTTKGSVHDARQALF